MSPDINDLAEALTLDSQAAIGIPIALIGALIIVTGVSGEFKTFISTRKQVPPPEGYLSKPIDKTEILPRDVDGRVPSPIVIGWRPRD